MNNYEPEMVLGQTFQKLKDYPEGNNFGPWDPAKFETEDSAFGFIKMKNGAVINLEASWALNILNAKEAAVTLCGTLAGVEMCGKNHNDQGYLVTNRVEHGVQVSSQPTEGAGIFGFAGADSGTPPDLEARQWLDAIRNNTSPLVKPEEAIVVTRILEAIYTSAATGKAVSF
jgi:predicted dehydrogenase